MPASARPPIRRLSPELVDRIAAGEVIERPASVVKELVENAFDAGARQVTVRIEGGGLDRIEVADDGWGIPPEELELAFERYATSKLPTDSALERIGTLGFRGEALASIASVAHVTLISRPPELESAQGRVTGPGEPPRNFAEGRAPGTTVRVERLFAGIPARRKFLKSPAAEQVEITSAIDRLHLARPEIGLALEANGAPVAAYASARDLREATRQVLGAEFADEAFDVQYAAPGIRADGWFGRPPLSRSSLAGLFLSVNGRTISSRALGAAIRVAFTDYLPRVRYPVGVVHLEIDPARLDVNVHPAKREIRIERESELADGLRRAIREALVSGSQEAVRPSAPRALFEDGGLPPLAASPAAILDLPTWPGAFARQSQLDASPGPRRIAAGNRHGELLLLGCLDRLYWVAASGADLVLLDQHAASERVLYNELLESGKLARQELVAPLRVPLTARQVATLRAQAETLEASGFSLEPFGGSEWRVRAVPSYRGRRAPVEELPRLLDELADGGRPSVPDGLRERVTASIACHAAVRGGDTITSGEMARILDALYAAEAPAFACPHGRPILYRIPRGRLDQWFGRSRA
jgi:DNA mismatch repair protein MutL